jgi:predicted MPP superfamily phosphohydrolase
MTRRRFVTTAAGAFPAIAVGSATAGVLGSSSRTVFPEVPMLYPHLPPGLEGLRILHLSDIHLGYFVDLEDLEQTIMDAETKRADLVLVTGDVADDLSVLSEALRLIAGLRPRHGIYASIGNHEYYRGIEQVRRSFDSGPFPLMIDEGTTLGINGAAVRISAADDPARTGRFNDPVFLRRSVERSVEGAPSDAFHMLMSHRPEGFDYAAAEGVDLTLSGHYHGGIQVGWGGRAIIQGFRPDKYYWGKYRKGESMLYTSGGLGHWFPFRLNCPPEAPIYVLGSERG